MPIGQYILSRFANGLTHDAAAALAVAHGGTLAAITSAAEEQLVKGLVDSDPQLWYFHAASNSWFGPWIGLTQPPGSSEPAGGWVWDTGETLTYTDWQPTQPDNFGNSENVAFFWRFNGIEGWGDGGSDPNPLDFSIVPSAAIEVSGRVHLLAGTAGHDLIWGGAVANVINGLAGNDNLSGNGGDDRISGGKGADSLDGGTGNDSLIGGAGADLLTGGIGADTFIYASAAESAILHAGMDHITDFRTVEGDKIDLHAIGLAAGGSTDPLHFIAGAFTGINQVRLVVVGHDTWVEANLTGDTTPDFRIIVDGVTGLIPTDFIL